jgi:capsular polysaccharide biosynthesis protein
MILVTSRLVTNQVISKLDLDMKHDELVELIQVENPEETRILNIKVEYKDPLIAKQIADAIRDTTTGLITSLTKYEQASRIVEANVPESASKPNVKYNTLLGGAVGAVISTFIIVLYYLADDTLKSAEEIEEFLDIRVLSMIPTPTEKNLRRMLRLIKRRRKRLV